jgi:hypothetical protein
MEGLKGKGHATVGLRNFILYMHICTPPLQHQPTTPTTTTSSSCHVYLFYIYCTITAGPGRCRSIGSSFLLSTPLYTALNACPTIPKTPNLEEKLRNAHGSTLAHANVLEPDRPAVVPVEPLLPVGEAARLAAAALGRVGAVEKGYVLVSNVAEPAMMLARVSRTICTVELASEFCLHPRTDRGRWSALAHRPISRRRTHQPCRGG